MSEVPQSFLNLIESEMSRPRRDGLTTRLMKIAKEAGYTFVCEGHQAENTKDVSTISSHVNFRGRRGGYIWDHFTLHRVCVEMLRRFESVIKERDSLKKELEEVKSELAKVCNNQRTRQTLKNLRTERERNKKLVEALQLAYDAWLKNHAIDWGVIEKALEQNGK